MLVLKLEATAGDDILDACREMIRISHTLNVLVELDFNATTLIASPRKDAAQLMSEFYKDRDMKNKKGE